MILLNNRQKMLLRNFEKFIRNGKLEKTKLVKTLFLLKQEGMCAKEITAFYSFYPYRFGPFSNNVYYDIGFLARQGLITEAQNSLTDKGRWIKSTIKQGAIDGEVDLLLNRFQGTNELTSYVYAKYPEYTIKSELIKDKHFEQVRGIRTVGYEGEDIDQFLDKLLRNNVTLLIDVRHNPFSMKYAFNKNKLSSYLEKVGVKYMHFPELGIPGSARKELKTSSDYGELFKMYREKILPKNTERLKEIISLSKTERVALMCFERDVKKCHRSIISAELKGMGCNVIDI